MLVCTPSDCLVFQSVRDEANDTSPSNEQLLTLRNEAESGTLTYKIKTTTPKAFSVRPNGGKLAPKEEAKIQITLQQDMRINEQKDKFMVQYFFIPTKHDEETPVTELWNLYNDGDLVQKIKIKCRYAEREAKHTKISKEQPPAHRRDVSVDAKPINEHNDKNYTELESKYYKLKNQCESKEKELSRYKSLYETMLKNKPQITSVNNGETSDVLKNPKIALLIAVIAFAVGVWIV